MVLADFFLGDVAAKLTSKCLMLVPLRSVNAGPFAIECKRPQLTSHTSAHVFGVFVDLGAAAVCLVPRRAREQAVLSQACAQHGPLRAARALLPSLLA